MAFRSAISSGARCVGPADLSLLASFYDPVRLPSWPPPERDVEADFLPIELLAPATTGATMAGWPPGATWCPYEQHQQRDQHRQSHSGKHAKGGRHAKAQRIAPRNAPGVAQRAPLAESEDRHYQRQPWWLDFSWPQIVASCGPGCPSGISPSSFRSPSLTPFSSRSLFRSSPSSASRCCR